MICGSKILCSQRTIYQPSSAIFFDELGSRLGFKEMEDWYNVSQDDIYKNGGGIIIKEKYNDSISTALRTLYPHHNWVKWKFKHFGNYLEKKEVHREFFDWPGGELGYREMTDWYKITWEDLYQHGGLLNYYNNSPAEAIVEAYPNHQWILSHFNLKKEQWERKDLKRSFFDWLSKMLSFKHWSDWYNVTEHDLHLGGPHSISYVGHPATTLANVYPKFNWMLWKFKDLPKDCWEKVANNLYEQKRLVNWLAEQLSIKSLEDWYRVSLEQVQRLIAIKPTKKLVSILQQVYPEHKWNIHRLYKPRTASKSSQRELAMAVQKLFPKYRRNSKCWNNTDQKCMRTTCTMSWFIQIQNRWSWTFSCLRSIWHWSIRDNSTINRSIGHLITWPKEKEILRNRKLARR